MKIQAADNRPFVFYAILTVIANLVCTLAASFGGDQNYWLDWVTYLKDSGFHGFSGNYPPLYVEWFWLVAKIYAWTGMPLVKDYTLKFLVLWPVFFAHLVLLRLVWVELKRRPWTKTQQPWILGLCALNPALLLDGPVWGQIDLFPALLAVLAVAGLIKRSRLTLWSPTFLVAALLCKFQMVAILPIYAGLALYRWKWFAKGIPFAVAAGVLIVLPWFMFDSVPALLQNAYIKNMSIYPYATFNAANLWMIVVGNMVPDNRLLFQGTKVATESWQFFLTAKGFGMTAFSLLSVWIMWKSWKERKGLDTWKLATLIMCAFFILLPGMHERYLLPAVPFAMLAWATDVRKGFLFLTVVILCTFNIMQINGFTGSWLWEPLALFGSLAFGLVLVKELLGAKASQKLGNVLARCPAPMWLPEVILALSLVAILIHQATPAPSISFSSQQECVLLTSLSPIDLSGDVRKCNMNRSYDNQPLHVGGHLYENGIGTHAPSMLSYTLPEGADSFYVMVGVDDEAMPGDVEFAILLDGQEKWTSAEAFGGAKPQLAALSLAGTKSISLVTRTLGPDSYDHADWLQPTITLNRKRPKLDPSLLHPLESSQDYKQPMSNASVDGHPLICNKKLWGFGWGSHAASRMVFQIPDSAKTFSTHFGIDDEAQGGEVQFRIELDGKPVWQSETIRSATPTGYVNIPLRNATKIALITDPLGSNYSDHADWLEPVFTK